MFLVLGGIQPRETVRLRVRIRGTVGAQSVPFQIPRTLRTTIAGEVGAGAIV